jgi:integrase
VTFVPLHEHRILHILIAAEGAMGRRGDGHIYKAFHAWHVRYYATERVGGVATRVQKSHRLCDAKNHTKTDASDLARAFLGEVKQAAPVTTEDVTVRDFWEQRYLPYCEREWKGTGMKPSTVYGYNQIWNQHLKVHFVDTTMRNYTSSMARRFLSSLKTKQGKNTLRHLRALAGAMFGEAVERGLIDANPWRGVKLPKDCREAEETGHYTLEEAEDIISSLVAHVDCQLIMALGCFLGLRPCEIAALKWEDIDTEWVHIRRSVVRGDVGTTKNKESSAPMPLIDQVRVPLELWRHKSGKPSLGWVFPSARKTPVDLHNLAARVIRPHIDGDRECVRCECTPESLKGTTWKGFYSGRRGAITAIIERNDGDAAVGQRWARHKSMMTTLNVYKKSITPKRLLEGARKLEAGS